MDPTQEGRSPGEEAVARENVIAAGLALWSAMTVSCGFARGFFQLALARVGVGVGEAAGSPPAHSLISDYFPPEKRATALGLYANGIYVGAGLAFLVGGYVLQYLGDWRTAFLVVGLPGIPLALLVRFSVRELPRGHGEAAGAGATTLSEVIRLLLSRRSFVWLVLAASLQSRGATRGPPSARSGCPRRCRRARTRSP